MLGKNGGAKRDRTADLNTASDKRAFLKNIKAFKNNTLQPLVLLVKPLRISSRLQQTAIKLRKSYAANFYRRQL